MINDEYYKILKYLKFVIKYYFKESFLDEYMDKKYRNYES